MAAAFGGPEFSFVKTMKKSYFKMVPIPASFIHKHGDKFSCTCKLGYGKIYPSWEVFVKLQFMNSYPHVSFGGGWKAFAHAYAIKEGDRLKFELVARGGFTVECVTVTGVSVVDLSSDDD